MKAASFLAVLLAFDLFATTSRGADGYLVFVSNERSGDVTVIDSAGFRSRAFSHQQFTTRPICKDVATTQNAGAVRAASMI
jgi:hypothetical protein